MSSKLKQSIKNDAVFRNVKTGKSVPVLVGKGDAYNALIRKFYPNALPWGIRFYRAIGMSETTVKELQKINGMTE